MVCVWKTPHHAGLHDPSGTSLCVSICSMYFIYSLQENPAVRSSYVSVQRMILTKGADVTMKTAFPEEKTENPVAVIHKMDPKMNHTQAKCMCFFTVHFQHQPAGNLEKRP